MKCILNPLSDKILPVNLKDGELVIIGRGPSTKIKESRCSRNQVEIVPNFLKRNVRVKQVGPNDSGFNGAVIGIGLEEIAKHGDIIEVLKGEYLYKVTFDEVGGTESGASRRDTKGDNPKPVKLARMFQPKSADEFKKDSLLTKGTWESIGGDKLLVYAAGEIIHEPKRSVGAFDMDGTIITTKSGRVFPKDDGDWKFLYQSTQVKFQSYFTEKVDFKFVIITNQAGIAKGSTTVAGIKKKIENITRQIGVPVLAFVSTGKNEFRKPLTGIWDILTKKYNGGVEPELATSFYCGDAAGRKKDHSKSDRLFALNLSLPFCTPEEFFMGQKPQEFSMPIFNPRVFIASFKSSSPPSNDHISFSVKQEMILIVGFPGSGKSFYVKSVLIPKSYVHINRDTLKTAAKCMSAAAGALSNGQSVVVDNTNPEKKDRAEYIKLAKKHGAPVRCFRMNVDHAQSLHNNKFRELANDPHASVPAVAFNSFKSKFQEPVPEEGFSEIVLVNFIPQFNNMHREELYSQFLLEK